MEGTRRTDFTGIWCKWGCIQRLRELDWQDFNTERRYWEHFSPNQEELYTKELEEQSPVALTIQQLLDSVENEQLLQILQESDKKTLQILLLKMWGFSIREIAEQTGIPEKTIYTRMDRLKKKIKKFLKGWRKKAVFIGSIYERGNRPSFLDNRIPALQVRSQR